MQCLTDLVEHFRVYAVCVPCGRMAPLDIAALVTAGHGSLTAAELRARVRCQRCRRRTRDIRIVYTGPPDRPAAFHYRG